MADTNVDVLIVGAGLGGVAAAIAASSQGASVMLVEASGYLGGQLTYQGVCTPDEDALDGQPVVETYGATNAYKELKHNIRIWYRGNTSLTQTAEQEDMLNIGQCWVNLGFATECNVAVAVLNQMLADANVVPIYNATVSGAAMNSRLIGEVTITEKDGTTETVSAKFILDATETGDLLPLFGLQHTIGPELESDTHEPDAQATPQPWIQPITYPVTLIRRPVGENHTIPEPPNYTTIRDAQKFSLEDGDMTQMDTGKLPFWTYRRVISSKLFSDPNYTYDVANINVKAMDFLGAIYPDDNNPANDPTTLADAHAVAVAYTYWLQTEAPRDDKNPGPGWPELMPATDFFNTPDAVAPMPYIRESRRISPHVRVVQQQIDADYAPGPRANLFTDSCGLGNYGMDVHAGANGSKEFNQPTKPFQIPAGSLVPVDCDNLLASGKCLGVTYLTNGAFRVHPQEWNIGESAGTLAAFCASHGIVPSAVLAGDPLLSQYQQALLARGVPLFWWDDLGTIDEWAAIQMCGVREAFEGEVGNLHFLPSQAFTAAEQADMTAKLGVTIEWPAGNITRAQAAVAIAQAMGWSS